MTLFASSSTHRCATCLIGRGVVYPDGLKCFVGGRFPDDFAKVLGKPVSAASVSGHSYPKYVLARHTPFGVQHGLFGLYRRQRLFLPIGTRMGCKRRSDEQNSSNEQLHGNTPVSNAQRVAVALIVMQSVLRNMVSGGRAVLA